MLLEIFKKINIDFLNDVWRLNLEQEGTPKEAPPNEKDDDEISKPEPEEEEIPEIEKISK